MKQETFCTQLCISQATQQQQQQQQEDDVLMDA